MTEFRHYNSCVFLSKRKYVSQLPWKYFDRVVRFGPEISYNTQIFLASYLQKSYFFKQKKTKANKVVNCPIVSFLHNFEYLNNLRSCCSWVVLIYLRRIFSEGSNFSYHSGELCFSKCFILEHDARKRKYGKKVKQKRTIGFSRLFFQS